MKKLWLLTMVTIIGVAGMFVAKQNQLPKPMMDDDEPILFI